MATVFVSPNGNDAVENKGLAPDTAFRTLDRAVAELRKTSPGVSEPDTITVMAGHYYQPKAVKIGPADSNLTIQGEPGAVIHGGLDLSGPRWTAVAPSDVNGISGVWKTRLEDNEKVALAAGSENIQKENRDENAGAPDLTKRGVLDLHVDRIRQTEARYKNESLSNDPDKLENSDFKVGWSFADRGTRGYESIVFKAGDVPDGLTQAEIDELEIVIYDRNQWWSHQADVGTINYGQRKLTLTNGLSWHTLDQGSRYVLSGTKKFLDAPREWYYDKTTGELFFKPADGQNPGNSQTPGDSIVAASTETLIAIEGSANNRVSNVTIRGLELVDGAPDGSNREGPWSQFGGGAIKLVNVDNVNIGGADDPVKGTIGPNRIENFGVGVNALSASNSTISNNIIDDIAGNGIFIGKNWGASHPLSYNMTVTDNEISDIGYRYIEAAGLMTYGLQVGKFLNNTIVRTSQFGIYAGEVRSTDTDGTHDVTIQHNIISQANLGSADGGGIKLYAQSLYNASTNPMDGVKNVNIIENWIDGTSYSMNKPAGGFYEDHEWRPTLWPQPVAAAIYHDYNIIKSNIDGNVVTGGRGGVLLNLSNEVNVTDNAFYDVRGNNIEINDTSHGDGKESVYLTRNVIVPNGIANQEAGYGGPVRIYDVDGKSLPTFTNNAYAGPAIDDNGFIVTAGPTTTKTGLSGFNSNTKVTTNSEVLVNQLQIFVNPWSGNFGAHDSWQYKASLVYFSSLSSTLIGLVEKAATEGLLPSLYEPSPPSPPPPPSASTTTQLTVVASGDSFDDGKGGGRGAPELSLLVDGRPFGKPVQVTAAEARGETQTLTFEVPRPVETIQTIGIGYFNDARGKNGGLDEDRNLYVHTVSIDSVQLRPSDGKFTPVGGKPQETIGDLSTNGTLEFDLFAPRPVRPPLERPADLGPSSDRLDTLGLALE